MKASFCFQAYLTHFKPKFRKSQSFFNKKVLLKIFFFYLGFLSRTFTIHGTVGEGGGYLFNSSLPLSQENTCVGVSFNNAVGLRRFLVKSDSHKNVCL